MKTQYKSIYNLLKTQSEKNPESIAIIAPDRSPMNYANLLNHVENIAKWLNSMGFGKNDRIAVVLPNGAEMATAFLCVSSCATCAPLNPAYSYSEFEFYLTDLNAKALIIQSKNTPAIDVAKDKGIPIIYLSPDHNAEAGSFTLKCNSKLTAVDSYFAESDDIALVLHTSGTTSRPKIVPLTHKNICISAENIQATLDLTGNDKSLNVMPLFHIHGLIGSLLSSISTGASVVLTHGFDAPKFFDWIKEFQPTWYTAVPTMHQAILSRADSNREIISDHSLRFIRSCSSALPEQVMFDLEKTFGIPVIEAYGMTEASHQVSSNPLPPNNRKPKSVGKSDCAEIAIMDEIGNILSDGNVGEIVIHGENVMNGYENNPNANQSAFTNGWFRTGDQGYLDNDNYLFITGRIKEIINRGGEKISPQEIDEVLMQYPVIAQSITFSVPHFQLGEDIASAIVFRNNYNARESDIKHFLSTKLASFKVPRRIYFVDEIPKGPTGKPQRIGMAEKLGLLSKQTKANMKTEYIAPRNELEKRLAKIWSQILRVEKIGVNDDFFYLGGDSLLAGQVIVRIRSDIHKELSIIDFFDNPTIANIASVIENKRQLEKTSTLVQIQSGKEDLAPLFCIHGCDGNVLLYKNLINYLDTDRPVYGLRMQGLYGEKPPHSSFKEMAGNYIKEIKSVQPKGPYYITGLRDGGFTALETACQLLEQGDEIAILVLIDTRYIKLPFQASNTNSPTPAAPKKQSQRKTHRNKLVHYTHRLFSHLWNGQLTQTILFRLKMSRNKFARKCYWRFIYSLIPRHIKSIRKCIDYEDDARYVYSKALFNYTPRIYTGNLALLAPEGRLEILKIDDWKELIPNGFDVVTIPGGHYNAWREPNIQVMAEKLKPYLDMI